MQTIGIIGGMSWEASARYYKLINEGIRDRLGKLHSAKIIMHSIDFCQLETYQRRGQWREANNIIYSAAKRIEIAGADFIIICSVTGHQGAEIIEKAIEIPLLHITDVVNKKIKGIKRIGLLGTRFTMEMSYFKDKLDAEVSIPQAYERELIDLIIYKELCMGKIKESSKVTFEKIIETFISRKVEAIILGCTEIGLLLKQEDWSIPIFDSTILHAEAAVNYALGGKQ